MQDLGGFEETTVAAMGKIGSKTDTTVQECLLQLAVILTKVGLERVLQICYFSRKVPHVDGGFNYFFLSQKEKVIYYYKHRQKYALTKKPKHPNPKTQTHNKNTQRQT